MQKKVEEYSTPPPNYNLKQHSINGFSQTPSVAQLASYFIISLSISIYFSCTNAIENYSPLLVLYIIFGTIMIVTSAISTIKDPTDRVVYYYKWSRYDKNVVFSPQYDKVLFCEHCDSYCYANSKHCRTCNRCVNNFDHHCMWFNNCVGERNYDYFFVSIISTLCYAVVVVVHVAIISFRVDLGSGQNLIRMILSWIIGLILVIFAFLIINLIFLHIYLICSHQTTYQFLQKKKKEEERVQQQKRYKQKQKEKKNQDDNLKAMSSDESVANTKLMKVSSAQDKSFPRKIQNVFEANVNEIVNENDFFEEQISRHSKKEDQIKEIIDKHYQNDPDKTLHNYEEKNASDDQRFPQFFMKNKSLKLLLSGSKAESPSRRKLQASGQK